MGQLLWAWNRIQGAFGDAFATLVYKDDLEIGLAVWHTLKTDSVQRSMLRALLKRPDIDADIAEELEWAIDVANKLSQDRNDITHTPMGQVMTPDGIILIPDPVSGQPDRVKRLSRADLKTFHSKLLGDLVALSFYAIRLMSELGTPSPAYIPLPKRPRMQSIPKNEIPLTRSQKASRSSRKSSSPQPKKVL